MCGILTYSRPPSVSRRHQPPRSLNINRQGFLGCGRSGPITWLCSTSHRQNHNQRAAARDTPCKTLMCAAAHTKREWLQNLQDYSSTVKQVLSHRALCDELKKYSASTGARLGGASSPAPIISLMVCISFEEYALAPDGASTLFSNPSGISWKTSS